MKQKDIGKSSCKVQVASCKNATGKLLPRNEKKVHHEKCGIDQYGFVLQDLDKSPICLSGSNPTIIREDPKKVERGENDMARFPASLLDCPAVWMSPCL